MRIQEFEDHGFFWLPQDERTEHQIPGVLRVSSSGNITLEIFGFFDDAPSSLVGSGFANRVSLIPRIVGVTKERGLITLIDCICTNTNLQSRTRGAVFSSATYNARWLFIGVHYKADESAEFSRLTCEVEGLDEWLGLSGFSLSGISADFEPKPKRATIEFQVPEDIPLGICDGVEGRIGFSFTIPGVWRGTTEASITQKALAEFQTVESWTVEEVAHHAMCLRDFLRLATDEPVGVTSLVGYWRHRTEPATDDPSREVPVRIIFESSDQSERVPKPFAPRMLFEYRDLDNDLAASLGRWFRRNALSPQPFRLFSAVQASQTSITLNQHFLSLTEALEAFDKSEGGGQWTKSKPRIRRLAMPFRDVLRIDAECAEFARAVSDTRNYLVHHDENLASVAADGTELVRLTFQCEVLLMCHFLALVLDDPLDNPAATIELIKDKQPVLRRMSVVGDVAADSGSL